MEVRYHRSIDHERPLDQLTVQMIEFGLKAIASMSRVWEYYAVW